MQNTLKLLIINISEKHVTSILEVLRKNNFNFEYTSVQNKTEIVQELNSHQSWDLIFISESTNEKKFKLLSFTANMQDRIPVIFFTENSENKIAPAVMDKGAKDCLSLHNLDRLPPITKRELRHKKTVDNYYRVLETKQVFSEITNLSSEEVYLFDCDTLKCTYTNKTALQKSGYDSSNIYKMTAADIYEQYTNEAFRELIHPLYTNQKDKISICTNIKRKKGGIYPSETHLRCINSQGKIFVLATNNDISAQWYKIQKLKRQRNLTQKYIEKNNKKDDFLANAAHDMRTSINSIILSNKLLIKQSNGSLENQLKKFTSAINYSGNNLLNYIEDFRESPDGQTDPENIDLEMVDIDSFCEKVFLIFDPLTKEKDIDFRYEISGLNGQKIKTNEKHLHRIIKNVISNAFKFTEKGHVIFRAYSPGKGELEQIDFESNNAVAFQIQDTGIGIPEAEQDLIFKRHVRTEQANLSASSGSGLGLNICKQLTEALGGTMHLESEPNVGSTFTIYLPSDDVSDKNDTKVTLSNKNEATGLQLTDTFDKKEKLDKTILVVDDSKMHNMAIKEFLSYSFSNCIISNSKKETYKTLNQSTIDCIILDHILFDTNSIEMARHIKNDRRHSNIPIIIYTGKMLSENEIQEMNKFVNAIVSKKNGSYNKLIETIYSCFHLTSPLSNFQSFGKVM